MKYYFPIILIVLFFNYNFAQDSSKAIPKEYKQGLEFQIGSLLNLTNFNNYTFSYRYCFNSNSGIRIGLYTSIDKDDYKVTQQVDNNFYNPPDYTHNYNIKISLQYLRSILKYNRFSLIWGAGPFFSYSKSETNSDYFGTSYISKYENHKKTISYGIDLILGVEYKLSENVILSGEYGLTITKANSDIENYQDYIYNDGNPDRIRKENGKIDSFTTRGLGVNLGISIFF